jgi:hypothetical protein
MIGRVVEFWFLRRDFAAEASWGKQNTPQRVSAECRAGPGGVNDFFLFFLFFFQRASTALEPCVYKARRANPEVAIYSFAVTFAAF